MNFEKILRTPFLCRTLPVAVSGYFLTVFFTTVKECAFPNV